MTEELNIFHWATSELSQDAFICWMIAWADRKAAPNNGRLHAAGEQFVNALLRLHGEDELQDMDVCVYRQMERADVVAEIGNEHVLLIEDKTNTSEHGDQLERYVEAIRRRYPDKKVLPVLYKTGNQANYDGAVGLGYKVFDRSRILDVLRGIKQDGGSSDIFRDYLAYVSDIERKTDSFRVLPPETWKGYAWEGFFINLQEEFSDLDWGYVPNASGGFMGAWWHSAKWEGWETYLQIEETKLCMKMAWCGGQNLDSDERAHYRDSWYAILQQVGEQHGFPVDVPARRGNGGTMTAATVGPSGAWINRDADGRINLPATVAFLRRAMAVLDAARKSGDAPGAGPSACHG